MDGRRETDVNGICAGLLAAGCLGVAAAAPADEVFKCREPNGGVLYQNQPCSGPTLKTLPRNTERGNAAELEYYRELDRDISRRLNEQRARDEAARTEQEKRDSARKLRQLENELDALKKKETDPVYVLPYGRPRLPPLAPLIAPRPEPAAPPPKPSRPPAGQGWREDGK